MFLLLLINIALLKQYGDGFIESIFYFMSLILPNHKLSEYKFTYCPRWHKPDVWTNIGENSFLGLRKQWRLSLAFAPQKTVLSVKRNQQALLLFVLAVHYCKWNVNIVLINCKVISQSIARGIRIVEDSRRISYYIIISFGVTGKSVTVILRTLRKKSHLPNFCQGEPLHLR